MNSTIEALDAVKSEIENKSADHPAGSDEFSKGYAAGLKAALRMLARETQHQADEAENANRAAGN